MTTALRFTGPIHASENTKKLLDRFRDLVNQTDGFVSSMSSAMASPYRPRYRLDRAECVAAAASELPSHPAMTASGPTKSARADLLLRREPLRSGAVAAADGPEPIQHAPVIDLIDDQSGSTLDRISRGDRVAHAHAEAFEHRTTGVPADRKGFVGNDLDGRGAGVVRAIGIGADNIVFRRQHQRVGVRRNRERQQTEQRKQCSDHGQPPFHKLVTPTAPVARAA